MSLAEDSSVHSLSSDDFAAFLDTELDATSDPSADSEEVAEEEEGDDFVLDLERVKRRKVELPQGMVNLQISSSQGEPSQILGSSRKEAKCPHPGDFPGMCLMCGQKIDDQSSVKLVYIHERLRVPNEEITRLRKKDFKKPLRQKKLYLVLDLDLTLLNSTQFHDITTSEQYINGRRDALPAYSDWTVCR